MSCRVVSTLLLCLLLINGSTSRANAADGDRAITFSIPPQKLATALNAFSDQSGASLSYNPQTAARTDMVYLIGTYSVERGLSKLLTGTDLVSNRVGANLFQIASDLGETDQAHTEKVEHTSIAVQRIGPRPIEALIVTTSARRRLESIEQLPLSAVIISQGELDTRDNQELQDISPMIPNMVNRPAIVTPANSPVIRGFISDPGNEARSPRVTVFHDGIYSGRSLGVDLDLLSVDHIEVVRGPQGTFFGRNTFAGLINVVTRKPDFEWSGRAAVQYGNYDHVNARAMLNVPVSQNVALRIEGLYNRNGGFGRNVSNNLPVNNEGRHVGQAVLRFKPDEQTDIILGGRYFHIGGLPDLPVPAIGPGALGPDNRFSIKAAPHPTYRRTISRGWMIAERRFDNGMRLKTSLGYAEGSMHGTGGDLTPLSIILSASDLHEKYLTIDTVFSAPIATWADIIVGLFYLRETSGVQATLVSGADSFPFELAEDEFVSLRALAPYVHADIYLGRTVTADIGLRFSRERKHIRYTRFSQPISTDIIGFEDDLTETQWTPTFGLRWSATDEVDIFTRVSKGFSGAGWSANLLEPADSLRFDTETVWSYEIGVRALFPDQGLALELIGFRMDSNNLLVMQEIPGPFANTSTTDELNAGRVRSQGFEASVTWTHRDVWRLHAGVGMANARFKAFDNGSLGIDFSGKELPNAPQWTLNFSVGRSLQVGNWGSVNLYTEYSYQDGSFADPANTPRLRSSAIKTLNASVRFKPETGSWRIAAYGENLLNRANIRELNTGILNDFLQFFGYPRTYRLEFQVTF